jgi:uncharacterized protein
MEDFRSFLGKGWSFPPHFSNTEKGVAMISDEEDIRNSLEILVSTRPGERILQPGYGCNLDLLLFEPIDISLQTFIRDTVYTAIYLYEPRIRPENVILNAIEPEGMVLLEIEYTIRSTNTRHNLVFPFYRTEGNVGSPG